MDASPTLHSTILGLDLTRFRSDRQRPSCLPCQKLDAPCDYPSYPEKPGPKPGKLQVVSGRGECEAPELPGPNVTNRNTCLLSLASCPHALMCLNEIRPMPGLTVSLRLSSSHQTEET